MSIIAQARLTLLSQKCCLSAASRRYDIHSGYCISNKAIGNLVAMPSIANVNQQQRLLSAEKSTQAKQADHGQSSSARKIMIFDRNTPDITVQFLKDGFISSKSSTIKENDAKPYLTRSLFDFKNVSRDGKCYKSTKGDETIINKTTRNQFNDIDRKFEKSKQNCYSHPLLFQMFSDRFTIIRRTFERSNYNGGSDKSSYGHHYRDTVALIAMMGFFNKLTNSDVEEERKKLSDDQKMKKMKPSEILIAKGVLSMYDQDYTKASELFHQALELSQKGNDHDEETLVLNLLASNYFENGDFVNAEKLFIHIIKRMIANNTEATDPAILELSLKLASIYGRNQASHEKAMKGFRFVINSLLFRLDDLLHKNVDCVADLDMSELSADKQNELALLGWSYDWFAKYLLTINDFDGAGVMLKRALDISMKVLGPLHDQTLILLNDVGTTMAMNNEPGEGIAFLQRAVEGAIESQSTELASFYVNLGLVNLNLRKFNEAKRYCEYSIEIATKNSEHHNSMEIIKLSRNCLGELKRLIQTENQ